jgi:hypothetical protein
MDSFRMKHFGEIVIERMKMMSYLWALWLEDT